MRLGSVKAMQELLNADSLLQDKEAMGETVANVRWLIATGIRDFQAMLDELGWLQRTLPRDAQAPDGDAQAPDEPDRDD